MHSTQAPSTTDYGAKDGEAVAVVNRRDVASPVYRPELRHVGTLLREVRPGLRRQAVFIVLYHLWCSGHERKLADAVVYIPAERVETVNSLA